MEFTGERYVPELQWPEISYEHWHRYVYADSFIAGKTVLDVACGEGYGCRWLAEKARRVVGVDISAEAVRHANERYGRDNLTFLEGSAEALPFVESGLFDIVTSFETIEHIDAAMQERFLRETLRVLKPDGLLLISTPNKLEYSDGPGYTNEFHIKEFYESEFREFLGTAFRHLAIMGQRVYPASFVWPLEAAESLEIRQLYHHGGGFAPLVHDARRPLYFVAAASNAPIASALSSVLLDVSARALGARTEELTDRTAAWRKEHAARLELDAANAAVRRRINDLEERLRNSRIRAEQAETYAKALKAEIDEFQKSRTWKLAGAVKRLLPRRKPDAA